MSFERSKQQVLRRLVFVGAVMGVLVVVGCDSSSSTPPPATEGGVSHRDEVDKKQQENASASVPKGAKK